MLKGPGEGEREGGRGGERERAPMALNISRGGGEGFMSHAPDHVPGMREEGAKIKEYDSSAGVRLFAWGGMGCREAWSDSPRSQLLVL